MSRYENDRRYKDKLFSDPVRYEGFLKKNRARRRRLYRANDNLKRATIERRRIKNERSRRVARLNHIRWDPVDDKYLLEHPLKTAQEMAFCLGRTMRAVQARRSKLRLEGDIL